MSNIRFTSYPRTEAAAWFIPDVVAAFRNSEAEICTQRLTKGLTSDGVLAVLRPALIKLGFEVEASKFAKDKIKRPVFFGENGKPDLQFEVDAFHLEWRCGLEIEAGRGWLGGAIFRDLVQALVMVDVDWLILAVANTYRFKNKSGGEVISRDYPHATAVAEALYGHNRIKMPYKLIVIGY